MSGELENLYTANTQHNNIKCQFQWFGGHFFPLEGSLIHR